MLKTMKKICVSMAAILCCACSGHIDVNKVSDDEAATGLRYFQSHLTEVHVYRVCLVERSNPKVCKANNAVVSSQPTAQVPGTIQYRIERVGDSIVASLPDPNELWELNYHSALFADQTLSLAIGEQGGVQSFGLTSNSDNKPFAVGTLDVLQKALETQRDFDKIQDQAKIDDLTRRKELIEARKQLEEALAGD